MRKLYLLGLIFSFFMLTMCQSLEDTYSDYAGDHVIRYVGKCSNLSVESGWKRLYVEWTNGVDPAVENIKLTWATAGEISDTLLASDVTSCNLLNLQDGSYEITVCGVDKEGNMSLPVTAYGRPYTPSHEAVRVFTQGITKCIPVRNNLMLFFDAWQDNISKLEIHYTSIAGEKKVFPITREVCLENYTLLRDVNLEKGVSVEREGRIGECPDLIVFESLDLLDREPVFTTDFTTLVQWKYGVEEITDTFINNLEELEIDYSITSLEDILYFPNLKKLVLGRNRYLYEPYLNSNKSASMIEEERKSLFVLDVAHELLGIEVERYNQHYFPNTSLSYMVEKGNPVLPKLNYLDATDWEITNSVEDTKDYDSHLEYLLDNNPNTCWETELEPTSIRLYDLVIDMKSQQVVSGLKIVQKNFDPSSVQSGPYLLPTSVRVLVSKDKITWDIPMYVDYNMLGNTNGEITLLQFPVSRNIRYIKLQVSDQVFGGNFGVTLADVVVF